ncbi:MAG: Xaa-Pro peptidase family protein, partial [Nanoarchaeota archaeon]
MRIKGMQDILEKKNLDFAFFYNLDSMKINPNIEYFSGYNGLGALVIPKRKVPFLLAPKMEYEKAKKSMVKRAYAIDKKRFFDCAKEVIRKNGLRGKNIAIDGINFNLNFYRQFRKEFKKVETRDISLDCLKLRQIKTDKEMQIIRKAFNYGDKILKNAINSFRDFKTESNASSFLEYEAKKLGFGVSFPPIVASGSNASMPHHEPENIKLKNGFCVIDFGIKYKGYCTDCTRTIYIGKPSNKEKDIYNFLLNAQKNIICNIKINDNCGKIYENCVKSLGKYSKYFIHGLGHGVGMEIHELPNLSLDSKDKIMENMVFTVEPGIYLPKKFGIRIEDTILMKNNPMVLTKAPKDLL